MDRGKKSKIQHSSSDFFALGKNDGNRKREATSSASTSQLAPASKKTRIAPATTTSSPTENWEEAINTECENSVDLISSVLTATEQQDSDKIVSLVCSAIKSLSSTKSKNDPVLVMSLVYLGKIRPAIFANDNITAALISLLKTDSQHSVRHTTKNNTTVFVMAANLLARGHFDKKKWPESFLKVYIDDAVNERLWVDSEECSFFTDHIGKFVDVVNEFMMKFLFISSRRIRNKNRSTKIVIRWSTISRNRRRIIRQFHFRIVAQHRRTSTQLAFLSHAGECRETCNGNDQRSV
jgi:hypothetical protein